MERMFENAARFMRTGPQNPRTTSLKTWQHNPQIAAHSQLQETLQAETAHRHIGNFAVEPALARSPNLDRDLHIAALGSPCFSILFKMLAGTHGFAVGLSLAHIIANYSEKTVNRADLIE